MPKERAGLLSGLSVRAKVIRAALFRPSSLKSFFNPAFVSNLSSWQRIFGVEVNEWGVHGNAFAVHPLVHRAISVIHDSAMGVPILLMKQTGKDMAPVDSGIEWETLRRPSWYMSRAQLIGATAALLKCPLGRAYWLIIRAGEARAIVLLQPEAVQPDRLRSGETIYRVTMGGGEQRVLEEKEVIDFKTFNPIDLSSGLGALQALSDTITDDIDIGRHNRQMVRNGGLYRPVLQTDLPLPEKGSAEDQALESELTKLLGTPDNRGKVVILPNGLKLSAEAMRSGTDMDYGEAQVRNVRKIAGATGVPPSFLGDYERDQADAEVQKLDLWDACVTPLLKYIADKLESDMWKITGLARAVDTGIRVSFDLDTVPELVKRKQSLWAGDTQDVDRGILTINEVRRRRGLPNVAWGDVWWASGLPLPVSSAEAPVMPGLNDPAADTTEPDDDEDTGKGTNIIPIRRSLSLDSDDMKVAGFLMLQAQFEGRATRALQAVLADIEGEVLGNLKSAFKSHIAVPETRRPQQVTEVLFDLEAATEKTRRALRPSLREAQMAGGRRGLRLAKVSRVFSVDAKPAIAYLARQEQRFAKPVNETTWERLKHSLEIGLREGEGYSEMAQRVERVMGVRRDEAGRTAQTEINAAANGGVELGFRQSEVVKKKRWLTAGDDAVRDLHRPVNGQTVGISDDFAVGTERMAFPGDPKGSAENVINCRCTIEPVLS